MRLLTPPFALTRSRFYALVYLVLMPFVAASVVLPSKGKTPLASKFFRDEDLSICLELNSSWYSILIV